MNKTHYSSSYKGIDSDVVVLNWCSEYVIPKEVPGTAWDEGGTAGADARSSEVQQAAADEAKKLVDAATLAGERLVDATKEAEETATAAAAAAAAASLSAPEEAQVKPE